MKRTYTILGATGNTGKPITIGLLNDGHEVRIVARNAEKAKELTDKGAQLFQGEITDVALLKKAFAGADAAYVLVPPNYQSEDVTAYQMENVDAIAAALRGTGVRYVVCLSSIGAHLEEGAGVVEGLRYMEGSFNGIEGLNAKHLRACYFMENTLGFAGMAKHMGMMGSSVDGDMKLPMVSTRDVAAKALAHLRALDFTGNSVEYVLGPRDITYNEVAGILGRSIGRDDLRYQQFPYDQAAQGMVQMGFSAPLAAKFNEFVKSLNEGRVLEQTRRDPQNTMPTSIEEFAPTWKAVYEMS